MTVLTHTAVRQRLAAFHDNEVAMQERIAIQSHLGDCWDCRQELHGLEEIRDAVRGAAVQVPADDEWIGLQPGIIGRMCAEAHESWTARMGRMFDDMHLVWIALASTAATILCGAIVLGMLHYASPERDDSLAAIIAVMAAPSGSDLNPMSLSLDEQIQAPSVPEDGSVKATLEQSGSGREMMLAFSAVVTREGRIHGLEVLGNSHDPRQVAQLVDAISRGRLEPARHGTNPIAVNLVWFVEHMTVKASSAGSRALGRI
jgi:hypothetical protein